MRLQNKHIILGVTGSIAAYKAPFLVRLLKAEGAEIKVILTRGGSDFATPLALATVSEEECLTDFYPEEKTSWNNHVDLGLWADLILIAPTSANELAKLAGGLCDNLLMAVVLSARCPVMLCPAMDLDMFAHPSTQRNLSICADYGYEIMQPESGQLASGLVGKGRMPEPEQIVNHAIAYLNRKEGALSGKKVIITSGPTFEDIDPVRFIGNHSTGKMGAAIAEAAYLAGAEVHVILGPNAKQPIYPDIHIHSVRSAVQMKEETDQLFSTADIAICTAAVSDYRPANKADQKIKKNSENMDISLEKNPDILGGLGSKKSGTQFLVGFALETQNAENYAIGKLEKKNLDMVVMNTLEDKGAGFGHDTNKVTFYFKGGESEALPLMNKSEVGKFIIDSIVKHHK